MRAGKAGKFKNRPDRLKSQNKPMLQRDGKNEEGQKSKDLLEVPNQKKRE